RSGSLDDGISGKTLAALTYSTTMVALLAVSSTVAGILVVGTQPLIGLSGALLSAGRAIVVISESFVVVLAPTLAFTCLGILISVGTRNSLAGVLVEGGPRRARGRGDHRRPARRDGVRSDLDHVPADRELGRGHLHRSRRRAAGATRAPGGRGVVQGLSVLQARERPHGREHGCRRRLDVSDVRHGPPRRPAPGGVQPHRPAERLLHGRGPTVRDRASAPQ